MESVSDQLRAIIKASGMSMYRIAQLIELDKATLSRFMAGKMGLSMEALDRLGALLNLKVSAGANPAKAKRTRKTGDL